MYTHINKDVNQVNMENVPTDFNIVDELPEETHNNNLRILYITFAIIIALLLLWIIIIVITRENPIKILGEMNNLSTQTPAITDTKVPVIVNDDYVPI